MCWHFELSHWVCPAVFSGVRDCECSCAYAVAYARHLSADTIVESANPNMMFFFSCCQRLPIFDKIHQFGWDGCQKDGISCFLDSDVEKLKRSSGQWPHTTDNRLDGTIIIRALPHTSQELRSSTTTKCNGLLLSRMNCIPNKPVLLEPPARSQSSWMTA